MNTLKSIPQLSTVLLFLSTLNSCNNINLPSKFDIEDRRIEYSEVLTEVSIVSNKIYVPKMAVTAQGMNVLNANYPQSNGSIGIVIVETDEMCALTFTGLTDSSKMFQINDNRKEFINMCKEFENGDTVKVSYKDVHRALYQYDTNGDKKRDYQSKEFVRTEFKDAEIIE